MKIVNQILNMGTLLMTQNIEEQINISNVYVKVTQPEINQMNFANDSILESITNGEKAMKRNISKLINLLQK